MKRPSVSVIVLACVFSVLITMAFQRVFPAWSCQCSEAIEQLDRINESQNAALERVTELEAETAHLERMKQKHAKLIHGLIDLHDMR